MEVSAYDLANIDASNVSNGTTGGFINNILNVKVHLTAAIEKLADMRAENEPNKTGS